MTRRSLMALLHAHLNLSPPAVTARRPELPTLVDAALGDEHAAAAESGR